MNAASLPYFLKAENNTHGSICLFLNKKTGEIFNKSIACRTHLQELDYEYKKLSNQNSDHDDLEDFIIKKYNQGFEIIPHKGNLKDSGILPYVPEYCIEKIWVEWLPNEDEDLWFDKYSELQTLENQRGYFFLNTCMGPNFFDVIHVKICKTKEL